MHHKCLFQIGRLNISVCITVLLLLLQVDFNEVEKLGFELPYVPSYHHLLVSGFEPDVQSASLCGCLWPLQAASVYIHWVNVCSGAAVQRSIGGVSHPP